MLLEGDELSSPVRAHFETCSLCSAELKRLTVLLSAVAAVEERPIDSRLLDRMAEGVMEGISCRAEKRNHIRWERKRWRGVKWASAAALPLAATMLLFLLPRKEDLSLPTYSGSATSSAVSLLSPNQWDMVWGSLTEDMPELSVLHQIPTIDDTPYEQIRDMTEDELESLLDLLEGSDLG
jgi:hypothetical protein